MSAPATTQTKGAINLLTSTNREAHIVNGVVDSRDLLGAKGKLLIEHESMKYELRLTRQGKLILTK